MSSVCTSWHDSSFEIKKVRDWNKSSNANICKVSTLYQHISAIICIHLQVSIKLWATHQSPMRTAMCEDEAMWQARGECWDCCTRTEPQKQWRFWRQQQNLQIKAGDESESHATDIFVRGTWMDVTLQLLRTGRRVSFGLFYWDGQKHRRGQLSAQCLLFPLSWASMLPPCSRPRPSGCDSDRKQMAMILAGRKGSVGKRGTTRSAVKPRPNTNHKMYWWLKSCISFGWFHSPNYFLSCRHTAQIIRAINSTSLRTQNAVQKRRLAFIISASCPNATQPPDNVGDNLQNFTSSCSQMQVVKSIGYRIVYIYICV